MAGNGAGLAYDRRRPARAGGYDFGQPDDKVKSRGTEREGMDAMQLELSNFQPLAANEAVEQEVQDLDGAEQLSAPMIESDQELASLIRSVGMTSITDIDNLVSKLQDVRNHLQSEGERIRAEIVRYTALTGAASASVKIILDALRAWRTADHSAQNQSRASAFEMTDAVIEDASDWGTASDGPSRSFG
jgi:hypothetical protein